METDGTMRRLSAILAADVVGYSRLVRADEAGTINAVRAVRDETVRPALDRHGGRVVKLMGDGLLAEFGSVVDAVAAAVAVQTALGEAPAGVARDRRIRLRIGVNLGDVVIDGDDIQGDGVNVAARLEGLAPAGGICISDAVHDQVRNRLGIAFESMGEQSLKNIDLPLRAWCWAPGGDVDEGTAAPGAERHDDVMRRPAVLFMPFETLGATEEDRVLALGLCEDIRTTLSSWRWFPVIGPEALGQQDGDLRSLADSVGASFAVTGSVRRGGGRARVTARLIEAAAGRELWSRRFDGAMEDVFDFQEDVSARIVSQLEPEIARAAAARIHVARPRSLATWQLLAEAVDEERRGGDGYGTPEANRAQLRLLREALEREPDLSEAWARLARCHFRDFLLGWADDSAAALAAALDASARAVELDRSSSIARAVRAQCLLFGRHDPLAALEHAEEAVRLNPSNVTGHIMTGCVLVYCGEPERAYAHYDAALRLNPNFPNMGVVYCDQMMCRALRGRTDEAVALAHRMIDVAPKYVRGLQRCAAVLAHAGLVDQARELMRRVEEIGGPFSESYVRQTYPFVREEHLDFLLSGLRKAGWTG